VEKIRDRFGIKVGLGRKKEKEKEERELLLGQTQRIS
jgi:hypothetical protein